MPDRLFVVVDTPTVRPPRGATLLRSANPVPETEGRWQAGIKWVPEACGDADVVQAVGYCGDGAFAGFPDPDERPLGTEADFVPPYVAVAQRCTALGGEQELTAVEERAMRLLENCQTKGIARELWTGTVATAETLPNNFLSNAPDDVGDGATLSVLDGIASLEQGLANCSCGGVGMIHTTAQVATFLAHLRLVERQPDGRLLTALGTLVVADPGYDGTGVGIAAADEDMASSWAYATGMVDIRLGPVDVLRERTDIRSRNDYTVYAFRPFSATFDPCCQLAAKLDHTTLT